MKNKSLFKAHLLSLFVQLVQSSCLDFESLDTRKLNSSSVSIDFSSSSCDFTQFCREDIEEESSGIDSRVQDQPQLCPLLLLSTDFITFSAFNGFNNQSKVVLFQDDESYKLCNFSNSFALNITQESSNVSVSTILELGTNLVGAKSSLDDVESSTCLKGARINITVVEAGCFERLKSALNCSQDICETSFCAYHGICRVKKDSKICNCDIGFTGKRCEVDLNECASSPCQHSSTCVDLPGGYECLCEAGFNGRTCEIEIDECASNPCRNNARCVNLVNNFTCTCASGYTSYDCSVEVDECSSNPCSNGGTCYDLIDRFYCMCSFPYKGNMCDLLPCDEPNPCFNFASCINVYNRTESSIGYRCICPRGYEGIQCNINTNECSSNPCLQGHCIDGINSFQCLCPAGYEGTFCNQSMDGCIDHRCENGGECVDLDQGYACNCQPGWDGEYCEHMEDLCRKEEPCKIGSTCVARFLGYDCICQAGFTGENCTVNVDECEINPCSNGGLCFDSVNNFTCVCLPFFTGRYCEIEFDPCQDVDLKCQNEGFCDALSNGTVVCNCSAGFTGRFCERNIDECASNPCLNEGRCWDGINGFLCRCPHGFDGDLCEQEINVCDSEPCINGGTCLSTNESYACLCFPEFTGTDCEIDVNECITKSKCTNEATCLNTYGSYLCLCAQGFQGDYCQIDVNECLSEPCHNNGSCLNQRGFYTCSCGLGFSGKHCQVNIDDCFNNECSQHGTCVDLVASYECSCVPGWTGRVCEVELDNCLSEPCGRGATCVSFRSQYQCICPPGFTGKTCMISMVDGCFDDETGRDLCENNGICFEDVDNFSECVCQPGFTGVFCEYDANECDSQPCKHNSTCTNTHGSFFCSCSFGYSGTFCDEVTSSCSSNPCLNGGQCVVNSSGTFKCLCATNYSGIFCENEINLAITDANHLERRNETTQYTQITTNSDLSPENTSPPFEENFSDVRTSTKILNDKVTSMATESSKQNVNDIASTFLPITTPQTSSTTIAPHSNSTTFADEATSTVTDSSKTVAPHLNSMNVTDEATSTVTDSSKTMTPHLNSTTFSDEATSTVTDSSKTVTPHLNSTNFADEATSTVTDSSKTMTPHLNSTTFSDEATSTVTDSSKTVTPHLNSTNFADEATSTVTDRTFADDQDSFTTTSLRTSNVQTLSTILHMNNGTNYFKIPSVTSTTKIATFASSSMQLETTKGDVESETSTVKDTTGFNNDSTIMQMTSPTQGKNVTSGNRNEESAFNTTPLANFSSTTAISTQNSTTKYVTDASTKHQTVDLIEKTNNTTRSNNWQSTRTPTVTENDSTVNLNPKNATTNITEVFTTANVTTSSVPAAVSNSPIASFSLASEKLNNSVNLAKNPTSTDDDEKSKITILTEAYSTVTSTTNHQQNPSNIATDSASNLTNNNLETQLSTPEILLPPVSTVAMVTTTSNYPETSEKSLLNGKKSSTTRNLTMPPTTHAITTSNRKDLGRSWSCTGNTCKNGATCVETVENITCICSFGWRGPSCEEEDAIDSNVRYYFQGDQHNFSSYLKYRLKEMPRLTTEIRLKITRPQQSCLLCFVGDPNLKSADYIHISFDENKVFVNVNLGSGNHRLNSETINESQTVLKIIVYRRGSNLTLVVNDRGPVFKLLSESYRHLDIPTTGHIFIGGLEFQNYRMGNPLDAYLPSFQGSVYDIQIAISEKHNRCWNNQPISKQNQKLNFILDNVPSYGRGVTNSNSIGSICAYNLCENDSPCFKINNEAHCICKIGWTGSLCEKRVKLCDFITCLNNGTCKESTDGFPRCHCQLGWNGKYCKEKLVISDPKFNSSLHSWISFSSINIRRETNAKIQFKTYSNRGLLFYSHNELKKSNCDFISISLSEYYIELRFSMGPASLTVLRHPDQIETNEWYELRVTRLRGDASMTLKKLSANEQNESTVFRSTNSSSQPVSLDVDSEFYVGGHPSLLQVYGNAMAGPGSGFTGCIRELIINDFQYDLDYDDEKTNKQQRKDGLFVVKSGENIEDCDDNLCGFHSCQNSAVCFDAEYEKNCICSEDWTGEFCEVNKYCEEGFCHSSTCKALSPPTIPECFCDWGWSGVHCNLTDNHLSHNSAVKFSGNSFAKFSISDLPANKTVLQFDFKTFSPNGIAMWLGKLTSSEDDHLSVGFKQGRLQISLQLGYGFDFKQVQMSKRMFNDNKWHRVEVRRLNRIAIVFVDGDLIILIQIQVPFSELNDARSLHVGGFGHHLSIEKGTYDLYSSGFEGCIKEIQLMSSFLYWDGSDTSENLTKC